MIGLFGVFFLACGESEEIEYNLFNAESDQFEVEIGIPEETEATEINLYSSTGQVVVGTAVLTPGGGPVGTEHLLRVEVENTWEADVSRVLLVIDAGDRGITEYVLERDSADAGYHQIQVQSVGEEGEERSDVFSIQLYTEDGVQNTSDSNESDTASN